MAASGIPWFSRGTFKYFEFDESLKYPPEDCKVKSMSGKCLICNKTTITGVYQCSTNFLRHVRSFHKKEHEAHIQAKPGFTAVSLAKKRRFPHNSDDKIDEQPEKRMKSSFFCPGVALSSERQKEIDDAAANYIISEARALHTVTRPAFRLFMRALNPRARPLPKDRMKLLIAKEFVAFKSNIANKLSEADSVFLTADLWTGRSRGFLGVIVHWIDKLIKRHSAAIACKRFKGRQTYETIAFRLHSIIHDYGL